MRNEIIYIEEPKILFGNNQRTEDPRDGLLLFGPHESWGKGLGLDDYTTTLTAGIIGTPEAVNKYGNFVKEIKKPIISRTRNKQGKIVSNEVQRPSFPGFESVFNVRWPEEPEITIEIDPVEIHTIFSKHHNRKVRTNKLVDLYLQKIDSAIRDEDPRVNIWFVLVPKRIYDNCRTAKGFGTNFSKQTVQFFKSKEAGQTSMFSEEEMFGEELSEIVDTSSDFHHLLKARANQERIDAPIQIIVEPKLTFRSIDTMKYFTEDMKAFFAWSISTTIYYKLGKKPWKLADMRKGVCYLGLVFKKLQSQTNKHLACSAAQLFLSDGDGTVFRGNNGLWMSENEHEYHLDKKEAQNLLFLALGDYYKNNGNEYPNELFIHGRATFSDDEWLGFQEAINKKSANTNLVGVVIKDSAPLKFFRDVEVEKGNFGVMRGIAWIISDTEAYLFTRGFIPRLNTSSSLEIPNPLHIKVTRGNAKIEMVLKDIMSLTKLNYNSCIYGDGKPVTLRFSDDIGGILTATPNWKEEKRQFRYYI